jgi:hypothetical protein
MLLVVWKLRISDDLHAIVMHVVLAGSCGMSTLQLHCLELCCSSNDSP